MKRAFLLFLFFILLIITILFYNKYLIKVDLEEDETTKNLEIVNENKVNNEAVNNFIKNLEYEISTKDENKFKIYSKSSEITYIKGQELILMYDVNAELKKKIKKQNYLFFINADKGEYDNNNYYTKFEKNVKINYIEGTILADQLILDLKKNLILIKDNIKYNGAAGTLKADNIKLDLQNMKMEIFMNESTKKVSYKSIR